MITGAVYRNAHESALHQDGRECLCGLRLSIWPLSRSQHSMHITRRTFVEQLATAAGAAALLPACHSTVSVARESDLAVTGPDTRPTFSAPLTHSDWML